MKRKSLLITLTLFCTISVLFLYANPMQVFGNRLSVSEKTTAKKLTPLFIKELITRMNTELERDMDLFPGIIQELEQLIVSSNDTPSVSILHSMAAQLYYKYYMNSRWIIDRRTPIVGYIPEDIRVWTSNIFISTIQSHVDQSLEHQSVLQKTPVSLYKDILIEGKDSPELRPTLFDFLAYRGIFLLKELNWDNRESLTKDIECIYSQLITFRKTAGDPRALLIAELDYARYSYTISEGREASRVRYIAVLDSLHKQYATQDFSVEVVNEQAAFYEDGFMGVRANRDSLNAIAYHLCFQGIEQFPHYSRIGILKNRLNELIRPFIRMSCSQMVYPGKKLKLDINYRNISRVSASIYESQNKEVAKDADSAPMDVSTKKEFLENNRGERVARLTFSLNKTLPYNQCDTTLYIPFDDLGYYECIITTDKETTEIRNMVSVSRLMAASHFGADDNILVTDYESGKPVEGAQVLLYEQSKGTAGAKKIMRESVSNKDGLASSGKNISYYRVIMGLDTALRSSWINTYSAVDYPIKQSDERNRLALFSDRGIYRPGQTVFIKGIAYSQDKSEAKPLVHKSYTLVLRGANGDEISKKEFKTNEFGSFNGSFVLPAQTLNGSFVIEAGGGSSLFFNVEEYKRPVFTVDLLPVTQEVVFGDTMSVDGVVRTFSGVNVQNATVYYTITSSPYWLRGGGSYFMPQTVAEGTTQLTADGAFKVSFRPQKRVAELNSRDVFYNYTLEARVTTVNGETEQSRLSFVVGGRSLILTANIPSEGINKDHAKLLISAKNQNELPVVVNGTFSLFRLKDKKELVPEESLLRLPVEKKEYEGDFSSGKLIDTEFMSKLASGRYLLCLEAVDSRKQTVTDSVVFVLYSAKDRKPPVFTNIWLVSVVTMCNPGENAELVFGTSLKDAHVLYEIAKDNKLLERKRFVLNDENRAFKIPFKPEFGDGVTVAFTFVKKGEIYSRTIDLKKKQPDHSLIIHTQTFRDRLLPGQKETWSFRVTNADSLPANAEVLASMYDVSLDKLSSSQWVFNPFPPIYLRSDLSFRRSDAYDNSYASGSALAVIDTVVGYSFDELNWQGLMRYPAIKAKNSLYRAGSVQAFVVAESEVSADRATGKADELQPTMVGASAQKAEGGESGIRRNFNETAFFYPSLITNKDGDVAFSFDVPQSNTTWKLRMLATTKELKYGQLVKEAISQKKLMVQPNLPRFMRWGDQVEISTLVMNLSDKEVSGKVRLELFNPETNEVVICLTKSDRPFTLSSGGMSTVAWIVPVPEGLDLIGCRIVADTPDASDGEQHLIPVLPNELAVTESTSFTVTGSGDKTVKTGWSPLSSTMRPVRMTLEYTNNPSWYAVQALPSITSPDGESAISLFSAYYGNALAFYIAESNPRIQSMVAQWEKAGKNAETLYSNLEKNQELKNILLQETPWVLAARSESEQKRQLSLLFDKNIAQNNRMYAFRKLQELQLPEGGWTWYKGMSLSPMNTLYILKGMAQLTRIGAIEYNEEEKIMQQNALRYIDNCMRDDYETQQKSKSGSREMLSLVQLESLFVRSQYRDIPENGDARDAYRYYTTLAEASWKSQSLYGKALTAQLLYRNGKQETAKTIVSALRKVATQSDDMGMYWANNRESLQFFISPINVHCQLMDAFNEIEPDKAETDRMKTWLLRQKQTQQWPSIPSTVNAIYALLNTGSDWLAEKESSTIIWGKNTYNTSSGEAGTGYIQEVVSGESIVSGLETLKIEKASASLAWGAVYRQYFEKIDKIESAKGALSIEKKLYVEKNSLSGPQLYAVSEGNELKVGNKVIVRLVIHSAQTMNYVYLKDLRAGCFEPVSQLSTTSFQDGVSYYRSPGDVAENFYFDRLPKGTFVFEYAVYVSRAGQYAGGISTLQCLYAPEFVSHTSSDEIVVKK